MSVGYQIRRKELRRQRLAERWRQTGQNIAILHGQNVSLAVRMDSFTTMGFFARLRWLFMGTYDPTAALRRAAVTKVAETSETAAVA